MQPVHCNYSIATGEQTRRKMFFKIDVLKNVAIFTGKNLDQSLLLIKLQAFNPQLY